ncbi:MAG: trehalase family glycosidase [Kiritimatiellaeota bacterium]|nr:trehalase family glycosidase [Kiritimatiellota bacterium]
MSKYADQFMFDTAFTKGRIWMWDTVWISHFGIYVQDANPRITHPMHGHDLFYGVQRQDGCIPHVWDVTGRHDWGVHNPIFSLGELNGYRHTGDKSRLVKALPILDRFFFYMKGKYSDPSGLYRIFDWNNGMDNRPCPGLSIDSTCEQAMVAAQLKEMAEIVGDQERAAKFENEHLALKKLINDKMWHAGDHFYVDCNSKKEPVNVWSVASYWALLSKVAPADRAKQMKDHLFDPANFKTPVMVPTLGRKSSSYNGKGGDYWRGSVWIPTSTMVIKGLLEYGYLAEAREIAINGLEGIYATWKNTGTLFENYDQEKTGAPGGSSKRDFVGWTGVQPIATLIETIIGIRAHAPENKITWTLRMTEKHGVRKLKWGSNYSQQVDLIADARNTQDDAVTIRVDTNAPFTLEVDTGFATRTFAIRDAGQKTFTISKH